MYGHGVFIYEPAAASKKYRNWDGEAAKSATDESKATNQALIIRQSAQTLTPIDKTKIVDELKAGQAKSIGDTVAKILG
jgi:hypothetical protein